MNRSMVIVGSSVVILSLVLILLLPSAVMGKVITSDVTWSGEVYVDEDVFIPAGVTLTISAGTIVRISPSESTKTDPEFMSPLTELIIRGRLVAEGTQELPITFVVSGEKKSAWAGIIIDGGKALLRHCRISNAETGVDLIKGSVSLNDSLLTNNRYGVVAQGREAILHTESTRIMDNDYGLLLLNGAKSDGKGNTVKGNNKKDEYSASTKEYRQPIKEYKAQKKELSRMYRDEALLGVTVWQGRIEVNGILRVPEGARLVIMPGTVVEFRKTDSNNDGIGENGLLIQGVIIAKGTKENPIFFRSAEQQKKMGDWDAVNIMNSDKVQNLIEFCQIEDAYRGLHFHFSNVAVTESVIRNNYRGIQFQESIVEISRTHFFDNKSALQARDSEISISSNVVYHNYSGINLLRNTLILADNTIINNYRDGLRVREGVPVVEKNLIDSNRYGLMIVDGVYGSFDRNVISHNLETGIALKSTDNIEIRGNVIQGNGLNGISIQDSNAVIQGNLISDNGDRGIGIASFQGTITTNNIVRNGLYNLGIDGETDVSARMNWWGEEDVRKTIFDKEKDPSKGRAEYLPIMEKPVIVPWPLKEISSDTKWHGNISIESSVSIQSGINLVIYPNANVLFSKGSGLIVKGKVLAQGEQNAEIVFTSREGQGPDLWEEIMLDHANGSIFSHCRFEHAIWALHSHFTDLVVEKSTFMNNAGGMRFTSGPIKVSKSLFKGNAVGIRAFRGTATITENVITENGVGIFVREKGKGLTITKNNLFANMEYSIRMGDFNDEDVDARDNWWGDAAPADAIYDAEKEPGIGKVLFEPSAKKPFVMEPRQ